MTCGCIFCKSIFDRVCNLYGDPFDRVTIFQLHVLRRIEPADMDRAGQLQAHADRSAFHQNTLQHAVFCGCACADGHSDSVRFGAHPQRAGTWAVILARRFLFAAGDPGYRGRNLVAAHPQSAKWLTQRRTSIDRHSRPGVDY